MRANPAGQDTAGCRVRSAGFDARWAASDRSLRIADAPPPGWPAIPARGGPGSPPSDRSARRWPHGPPASRPRRAQAASSTRCRTRTPRRASGRRDSGRASRLSTWAASRSSPSLRSRGPGGRGGRPRGHSRSRAAARGTGCWVAAGSCRVAQTTRGVRMDEHPPLHEPVATVSWSPGRRRPTSGSRVATAIVSRRSGARPSSSRGRRRSIRAARRRRRRASRSGASATVVGRRERRLMSSAASSSTSVRRSSGTPHVSSASTSPCAARTGTSSSLRPVSTLTTPPGTSDVASTSVSVTAGSGRRLGGDEHDRVAGHERRREPRDQAQQRRRLGRDHADHAGRLRDREVEVRGRDRVRRAQDLGDLVGPAGVPDPAVDGAIDDRRGGGRGAAPRRPPPRRRTGRAGPPSAPPRGTAPGRGSSRSCRPSRGCALRAARTASRRSLRDARQAFASGVPSAPRTRYERPDLGPRERAADVQLVGLADLDPGRRRAGAQAAACARAATARPVPFRPAEAGLPPRDAISGPPAGRRRCRPCIPPSRPKPDSL